MNEYEKIDTDFEKTFDGLAKQVMGLSKVVDLLMQLVPNPFNNEFSWDNDWGLCYACGEGLGYTLLRVHKDDCPVTLLRTALTNLGYREKNNV